jgi:hypothetical protein
VGRNRTPEAITVTTDLGSASIETDPDNRDGYLLVIDGAQQSYVDLGDPTNLDFEYCRWIGHAISALPAGSLRVLHLGGGGLTLPRYVSATRPGSRNTVVELDAKLVDLVRARLPWGPGIRVRIGDARTAVAGMPPASFDVVISDVFAGARTPGPLTTLEFLAQTRQALVPTGMFCANIADQSPFEYARRYLAGVAATYPEVAVLADPAVWRGRRFGNFVAVAGACVPNDLAWRVRNDPWAARVASSTELQRFLAGAVPFTDADSPGSPEPPEGVFSPPR